MVEMELSLTSEANVTITNGLKILFWKKLWLFEKPISPLCINVTGWIKLIYDKIT